MNTYIALFRGINVGGHNKLLMKDLRSLMKELGFQKVNSYIQTGNVVFEAEKQDRDQLSERISARVEENHGFKPKILVLEREELQRAIAANPYPEAEQEPRSVHLMFLASTPSEPDLDYLDEKKKESESYTLTEKVFYLYAPDGIGRSKLASNIEKGLGVSTTGRNWRTVKKIYEMVETQD